MGVPKTVAKQLLIPVPSPITTNTRFRSRSTHSQATLLSDPIVGDGRPFLHHVTGRTNLQCHWRSSNVALANPWTWMAVTRRVQQTKDTKVGKQRESGGRVKQIVQLKQRGGGVNRIPLIMHDPCPELHHIKKTSILVYTSKQSEGCTRKITVDSRRHVGTNQINNNQH